MPRQCDLWRESFFGNHTEALDDEEKLQGMCWLVNGAMNRCVILGCNAFSVPQTLPRMVLIFRSIGIGGFSTNTNVCSSVLRTSLRGEREPVGLEAMTTVKLPVSRLQAVGRGRICHTAATGTVRSWQCCVFDQSSSSCISGNDKCPASLHDNFWGQEGSVH